MQEFLDKTKNHRDYAIIYTAIYTGIRQGEILELKWESINFDTKVLAVVQQLQYIVGEGYIFREPKSTKSKRQIPLTNGMVTLLKEIKKEQAQNKLLLGPEYEDSNLVFTQENGKLLDGTNLIKRFKRIATKHGHHEMRFHDLRHTSATLLLAVRVDPKRVQDILTAPLNPCSKR